MKLKYTHFLLAFFIITLCSTTAMATQNNHTVMRFVVCSDLHDWKGSGEKDIINFINWSNNEHNSSLGLNYTFFNGDMFSGSNNVSYNNLSMKTLQDKYWECREFAVNSKSIFCELYAI